METFIKPNGDDQMSRQDAGMERKNKRTNCCIYSPQEPEAVCAIAVWASLDYSLQYGILLHPVCVCVYMLIVSVVVIGNIRPGKIRTVKNVNTVGGNKTWSVTKFTEEFRRVDEVLGGLKHHSHATHTHTKCNGAFRRSLSTLNAWNRFTAYKLYCISWFDFFLGQNLLSSRNNYLINKLSNYFGRYLITLRQKPQINLWF